MTTAQDNDADDTTAQLHILKWTLGQISQSQNNVLQTKMTQHKLNLS